MPSCLRRAPDHRQAPRWLVRLVAFLVGVSGAAARPALAEPPSAAVADRLARAKELNREGIALLDAGENERALDYFRRSRQEFPSSKNVANVAICLDKLGRYDEALEVYEELLTRFASGLDEDDKAAIAPAMAALRARVGSLVISSSQGGALVIDGRARGELPLAGPVRVLRGPHLVRVLKDGYETFEAKVVASVGMTLAIDAVLKPLSGIGQLRIEDPTGSGVRLFVDRAEVGAAPWEGIVAVGRHLIWSRGERVGTAPIAVTVVERQTILVRLDPRPLGPEFVLRAEPRTALLEIDGTAVGTGSFQGVLPAGEHTFVASEPGYSTYTWRVDPAAARGDLLLRLVVDPNHPRWPKPSKGKVWFDAMAGYAASATPASGAAKRCVTPCTEGAPGANGVAVGGRIGYRFQPGVSIDLAAGYLSLWSSFDRTARSAFGDHDQYDVTYRLHDDVRVQGPFVEGGGSLRVPLGGRFAASARLSAGALVASSTDPIDGTAATTGPSVPVIVGDRNRTLHSAAFYFGPSVGLDARLGPVTAGVALAFMAFPVGGPAFAHEPFQATPNPTASQPGAVGNARGSDAIRGEPAYGAFSLWVPQLHVEHVF